MQVSQLWVLLIPLVLSSAVTFLLLTRLIPVAAARGIVAKDRNKPGEPLVPEIGGLALLAGVLVGLLITIFLVTFTNLGPDVDAVFLLAALGVVAMVGFIGVADDILGSPKWVKALLPAVAALPLVVVKAGESSMSIGNLISIDLGIFYPLVVIPLAVTGASNAVNVLGGFNGLEVGMGLVIFIVLSVVAFVVGSTTGLVIGIATVGTLAVVLYQNWYPAKVFIGDLGTLTIGSLMATMVILGNFELAGEILILPYFWDFLIKLKHGLPSEGWWGIHREGKLYCPEDGPLGLCQWMMKMFGGLSETGLVSRFIAIEIVLGVIVVLFYLRP